MATGSVKPQHEGPAPAFGNGGNVLARCLSLGLEVGRANSRSGRRAAGYGSNRGHSQGGQQSGSDIGTTGRPGQRRGLPAGAQPDRFRPAPPASGQSRPAVAGPARGGYLAAQSVGLPPQSVSPSGQALPGRIVDTGPPERSGAGRQAYAGGVRQPAKGLPRSAGGIAHGLALAYHGGRRRGVRPVFRVPAGLASAVRRRGPGCHSSVSGRQRLPGGSQGGRDGCGTAGLGTGLRAGVAFGGRGQLGDATLGASSIPRSRPAGSPAAG